MTLFASIELLFPVVLGLHTAEEFRHRDRFVQRSAVRWVAAFTDARTLRVAAVLMVLAAVAMSLLAYLGAGRLADTLVKVSIFALLFNALGHGLSSLVRRTWVPGTFSAIGLVLPYSAAAIATMHVAMGESARALLAYAAMGALGMPLAPLVFLAFGRLLALPARRRLAGNEPAVANAALGQGEA